MNEPAKVDDIAISPDLFIVAALVGVLLLAVLVFLFFLYSQRKLKADAQRIREEYGTPGERDLAIAQLSEANEEASRWSAQSGAGASDVAAQIDDKIAQAQAVIRTAEQQIARLEDAIARAKQLGR